MKTFSFTGAKKIVFGNGSFSGLAEHLTELKVSRPLVVLDVNLAGTGFGEGLSALRLVQKSGKPLAEARSGQVHGQDDGRPGAPRLR